MSLITFAQPRAEKGIMDLRKINFAEAGVLPLAGEWQIIKDQFLDPCDEPGPGSEVSYNSFGKSWSEVFSQDSILHQFGYVRTACR
ncbi:MAG: hypothetical protein U5L96_00535 [Owenweeksia sp.]|nr:hypothetical protein [Owenweeksia sp.]